MTAGIILAAGRGSRLRQLTDLRPKCLVEVNGRTLLSLQAEAMAAAGIWPIAAVIGYRGDMVADQGFPVFRNDEWETTGIFRSLSRAGRWLRSGPVVVSYGDIFYTAETAARLVRGMGPLVVAYDPDWWALWSGRSADPISDAESFRLAPDGSLAEIGGTIVAPEESDGQYMGLFKTTPEGWSELLAAASTLGHAAATSDMTSLLSAAIGRGAKIGTVPCTGPWGEVDTAADIQFYESRRRT